MIGKIVHESVAYVDTTMLFGLIHQLKREITLVDQVSMIECFIILKPLRDKLGTYQMVPCSKCDYKCGAMKQLTKILEENVHPFLMGLNAQKFQVVH